MINADVVETVGEEAGIFFWQLENDLLYGDSLVATLFGLDSAQTVKGLPLEAYMASVHVEDRPMLAKAISKAGRDGLPYHAEYRVIDDRGVERPVIALGRCFRDQSGNPAHYAGIVYPIDCL